MPEGSKGWDETSTSYRYRIRAPDEFQDGSFRTIELQNTAGIKMVVGKLKNGTGSMVAQSLIFPKDQGWTMEKAKKWVKDHPSVEKSTGELPMPLEPITKEQWTTEFINSLPDAAFAVIEPAYLRGETNDKRARHLPHHGKGVTDPNDDSTVDLPHLRNALARVNQIQPVTDSITAEELRRKAMAHLQAHAKRLGIGDVGEVKKEVGFKKADLQKRIVYGEVYVPNEKDSQGQWMTAEEIEKMAHRFMENLRLTKIDKQHDWDPDEGVVVESFIARPGDPDFTPGAWVLGTKILKEETWQAILKGEINSYSMAGVGELIPGRVPEGGE